MLSNQEVKSLSIVSCGRDVFDCLIIVRWNKTLEHGFEYRLMDVLKVSEEKIEKVKSGKIKKNFLSLFRNSHVYECSFLTHCLYI